MLIDKFKYIFVFLVYFFQFGISLVYAADHQGRVNVVTERSSLFTPSQPKSIEPDQSSILKLIPRAPDFNVKSYVLIDADSGDIVAEKNAHQRLAPASLTKLMTLYLVAGALHNGQIRFDDKVAVSNHAWKTGGSRMFIKPGSNVLVKDLVKGIAVASGNDATVAMAEFIGGTEPIFVDLMNQTARSLKMINTSYADSSGLPHDNNYSTASDLALLTKAWLADFPEYYPWFKERKMAYNGIKQSNRNLLLWRDPSIDGVKTGHTEEAGYCLISSAKRNGMRLIAVVMGASNEAMRAKVSLALLNYGFRFFETHKLFVASTSLTNPRIYLGKNKKSSFGLQKDLYVTVPIGQYKNLKANAIVKDRLKAPIAKGRVYGSLNILLDNKVIAKRPLVALQDNPRSNFIFAIFDYILMLFK